MGFDRLKGYKDRNFSKKRRHEAEEQEQDTHTLNVSADLEERFEDFGQMHLADELIQEHDECQEDEEYASEVIEDDVCCINFNSGEETDSEEENVENGDISSTGLTVEKLTDKQLVALLGALQGRESSRGFSTRTLLMDDDEEEDDLLQFWEEKKKEYTNIRVCNGCGGTLRSSQKCEKSECKSGKCPVLTLTMLNLHDQLHAVVSANFSSIMEIRRKLKSGEPVCHNLQSRYFSQLWKNEKGSIDLSLQLSVDGCCPHGNTKKKVWPICFSIIDIGTAIRQKAVNIILFGVMSGKENPSTHAFNTIVKFISSQLESMDDGIVVNGETFTFHIVCCGADQPAKRALFGFDGHNSEFSCFFCLDDGAFYKKNGYERYVMRKDEFLEDSRKGRFGNSGTVFAEILELLAPWDCVIDVLHNLSEGIITIVIIEMFPSKQTTKSIPKSRLFVIDEQDLTRILKEVKAHSLYKLSFDPRNGTERLDFFRVFLFQSIIKYECAAETKLAVIGIALLVTKICTDCETGRFFYADVCDAVAKILEHSSIKYFCMKPHEVFYHLPYISAKMGNIGPLSTEQFESFYNFFLSEFSSQLTKNFVETACTRLLLHDSCRREMETRLAGAPSFILTKFAQRNPSYSMKKAKNYDRIITNISADDEEKTGSMSCYSNVELPCGKLESTKYGSKSNDIIFYGDGKCGRFLLYTVEKNLLVEPIVEEDPDNMFPTVFDAVNKLPASLIQSGKNILRQLKLCKGVQYGKFGKEKIWVEEFEVLGVGSWISLGENNCFLQCNGSPNHK